MQSLLINTPYDIVGHPIFKLGRMLVTRILDQTTRGQTLWRSVHLEMEITTWGHIAKIYAQPFAFSNTCKSGHMEKQETEIKRKLEMETGNGNWKLKTNGNATSSLL